MFKEGGYESFDMGGEKEEKKSEKFYGDRENITPEQERDHEKLYLKDRLQNALIIRNLEMDEDEDTEKVLAWIKDHSEDFGILFKRKYEENPYFIDAHHDIPEEVIKEFERELYGDKNEIDVPDHFVDEG